MKISKVFIGFILALTSLDMAGQMVIRGPYLQMPLAESIIIRWRTDSITNSRVQYGTTSQNLSTTVDDNAMVTEHEVTLTGLSSFTLYYYSVGSSSQTLSGPDSLHYFKTSPLPGADQPVKIWAIGDFGKANTREQTVRDAFLNHEIGGHPDVWIWLGDNAYDDGTDQEYQDKVFSYDYYGNVLKNMPFWPCPGNHDYNNISSPLMGSRDPKTHTGAYYDIINAPTNGEAGGVPSNYELYYSFDYANVHFVSLNSELGAIDSDANDWTGANPSENFTGSPMTEWLIEDLGSNTLPWVIVYFHQLPYSKGSHDSDDFWELYMQAMREHFVPIFDQFGVDLVVNGHSHVYERSMMIKGHSQVSSSSFNPATMVIDGSMGYDSLGEAYVKDLRIPGGNEGTVYAVVGCSGSFNDDATLDHPVMVYNAKALTGSLVIDVDGNRLDSRFIRSDGEILDHFTMLKIDSMTTNIAELNSVISNIKIYPNPFENETRIEYRIIERSNVQIELLDLSGKKIQTIFSGDQGVGSHFVVIKGDQVGISRGTYLVDFLTNNSHSIKKVVKVR